jgi:glycosyltransferase involved in cell wall biosynthesis
MPPRSANEIAVLITGAFHAFGGIETFNRSLIKALDQIAASRDLRVRVFSLLDRDDHLPGFRLLAPATEVHCFSADRVKFARAALAASRQAARVLIGHINFSPLTLLMPGPHSDLFVYGIDVWKTLPLLQKLGVRRVRRLLSISAFTADRMAALNRIPRDRFTIVPLTLDPVYAERAARPAHSRPQLGLPPGPMLLSVSRLSTFDGYKNVDRLIHALPAVFQRLPHAFSVIIGDGDDRPRLQSICRSLGIASRVFFPGRVSDELLPAYYHNSDLFVLPSTKEGFGIVFLEAMYYAKPCLGANWGGVPEVVKHNETGILVDSPTSPSLQAAILQLLGDPALMLRFGQQGRARFDHEFSLSSFRDRLERLFCPAPALPSPEPLCASSKLA